MPGWLSIGQNQLQEKFSSEGKQELHARRIDLQIVQPTTWVCNHYRQHCKVAGFVGNIRMAKQVNFLFLQEAGCSQHKARNYRVELGGTEVTLHDFC